MGRAARATFLGLLATFVLPAVVLAHPLGNFTINHYAGLRIEPDRVQIDLVIDQAEIPSFQARQALDLDEDGQVSDREIDRGRVDSCEAIRGDVELVVAGVAVEPRLTAAGLSLSPGAGGLPTLRLVCAFEAGLPSAIEGATRIEFEDRSYATRLGWREIVVVGSGVAVRAVEGELRAETESGRLTAYPANRLDGALADERVVLEVAAGGPVLPAWQAPDAQPLAGAASETPGGEPVPATGGVAPGGVGGDIPALFQAADLTPIVLLLSVLTAAALGAGHALTPGHGKTLMAAYLVGTRGTPVHAIGLGLSVSVSHTAGILLLALLVVGAQGVLDPDLVARVTPVVASVTIVGIGAWMLVTELRRRSKGSALDGPNRHAVPHTHAHRLEHEHGGVGHSHLPTSGSSITWRSLFVLGLAGGLIPSTNALLILLGTIAGGRPAFGLVLVIAFGLGMALVMAGVGLVLVLARGRLDGLRVGSKVGRVRAWLPLGAACVVLGLGLYLTIQAVTGPTIL